MRINQYLKGSGKMQEYKFIDPVSNQPVTVGNLCKRWRILNNYKISEVAETTGYSEFNIIKFEQGQNNNMMILLWYIEHGFDISRYKKEGDTK